MQTLDRSTMSVHFGHTAHSESILPTNPHLHRTPPGNNWFLTYWSSIRAFSSWLQIRTGHFDVSIFLKISAADFISATLCQYSSSCRCISVFMRSNHRMQRTRRCRCFCFSLRLGRRVADPRRWLHCLDTTASIQSMQGIGGDVLRCPVDAQQNHTGM